MQHAILWLCGEAGQQLRFESIGEDGGWFCTAPDREPICHAKQGIDLGCLAISLLISRCCWCQWSGARQSVRLAVTLAL